MKKRLLSLLLCVVMLFSLLPTAAMAETGTGEQTPADTKTFTYAATVESGKQYLLVSNGYAVTFNGSGKTVAATQVTVNDNKITLDSTSSNYSKMLWTAGASSEFTAHGTYTFKNGNDYFARVSNSNYAQTQTEIAARSVWQYNGNDLFHKNTQSTLYYVNYNGGFDVNQTDANSAELKLYVLDDSTPSEEDETNEVTFTYTDTVEKDKQYLLVSNGYAVTFNESGKTVAATQVTVNDNKITLDSTSPNYSKMLWTAGESSEFTAHGTYTFKNGNDYFARVSQNNYAQTQTDIAARSVWQYNGNDLFHKNTQSTLYYVNYNGGFDVNQTDANSAELKLYVLDDSTPSEEDETNEVTFTYTDTVEKDKQYLLVSNGYALTNASGASVAATKVTVNSNTITLDANGANYNAMLWTAGESSSYTDQGKLTFKNGSDYLARTGGTSNTAGTEDSVSKRSVWTYDGSDLLHKNSDKTLTFYVTYSNGFTANVQSANSAELKLYVLDDSTPDDDPDEDEPEVSGNTFKKVSQITNGKDYIIAVVSGSTAYCLDTQNIQTYEAYSNSSGKTSQPVSTVSLSVSGETVTTDNSNLVFKAASDSGNFNLIHGNYKLYAGNHQDTTNPGLFLIGSSDNTHPRTFSYSGTTLKAGDYYVTFTSGTTPTFSANKNNPATITIFERVGSDPVVPGTETRLAFTSDVHNGAAENGATGQNIAATRLAQWLHNAEEAFGQITAMGFCGDMGPVDKYGDAYFTAVKVAMDKVDAAGVKGIYTTGNHEYMNGNYSASSTNATAKKYKRIGEAEKAANYIIYCFGASSSNQSIDPNDVNTLRTYLQSAPKDIPIFILSHYPLHRNNGRDTANKESVITLLNGYPNVIYLWGHNHTESDSHYDKIYTGKIDNTNINFTYAAAGCMSDTEKQGSSSVKGKGLLVQVSADGKTVVFRYLKENGTLADGTSATTITITGESGSNPGSDPEIVDGDGKYLIISNGYALSTAATDNYTTSGGNYSGFKGTRYNSGSTTVTNDMLWDVTISGNTYTIKQNGKYLTGNYTARTNNTGSMANATLTLETAAFNWTYSGNKLFGGNGYLTHSDGTAGVTNNPNVFSVRSSENAGTITFVPYGTVPQTDGIKVGHSLVLSGQIGVNFIMTLPDGTHPTGSYMEFIVSGKDGGTTRVYLSDATILTDGRYQFTCYVNSIQMADTITATYHYGNKTYTETYSVKKYIETLVADKSGRFDETTIALGKAIADYGYYAQKALSAQNGFTVGAGKDHEEMIHYDNSPNTSINLSQYTHTVTERPSTITETTRTLFLDSNTSIRIYCKVTDRFTKPSVVTIDGSPANMVREADGRYTVTIPSISAHLLGKNYVVKIGNMIVTTSALAYVKDMLASDSYNANMKNAAAALYQYYDAAIAYQTAHPTAVQ